MTLLEHNLAAPMPSATARRIQVRWTCMQHGALGQKGDVFACTAAVLSIDVLDEQRATVHVWVEEGAKRREVFSPSIVKAQTTLSDGLLQIDAGDLCRVSVRCATNGASGASQRPLFAACSLLSQAGFLPGKVDPPTATLSLQADAISA